MRYSHILHKSRTRHSLFHWQSILTVFLILTVLVTIVTLSGSMQIDKTQFIAGLLASLTRVTIAYLLAFAISIIIALTILSNKTLENIFLPILDVLQSFPSFVLFPLLVNSIKNEPDFIIIMVLMLEIIWPILFAIISGIKGRREDLEEAATVFGATGRKRFLNFTLPMLLPSIITGSIVGWGEGWESIIAAELLISTRFGVGKYLGFLGATGQNKSLVFGVIVLLFFLFIINKLIWLPLLHTSTKYQADA